MITFECSSKETPHVIVAEIAIRGLDLNGLTRLVALANQTAREVRGDVPKDRKEAP